MQTWNQAQKWESNWWGDCLNTYSEETKQIVYAKKMGLVPLHINGKYPVYDLAGKGILDIGCGPVSMLLKCINRATCIGIDPCDYPEWVYKRYYRNNINFKKMMGEEIGDAKWDFDEAWIYNVLQHTENPELVARNALRQAKLVRVFEWVNIPATDGHLHVLTKKKLDEWFGGYGITQQINENGAVGECYFGIFKGEKYAQI